MVQAAARRGADWRLVYTGRSLASMPFRDELAALPADRVRLRPDDEHGVPTAQDLLAEHPPDARVYCCGPVPMIDAVRAACRGALHYERFSPPPVVGGRAFDLELARSGRTVRVPADRSALAAVRDVLPDVAYSCGQGFCGTCAVPVLAGAVEPTDDGVMRICVARAVSGRVVVDL